MIRICCNPQQRLSLNRVLAPNKVSRALPGIIHQQTTSLALSRVNHSATSIIPFRGPGHSHTSLVPYSSSTKAVTAQTAAATYQYPKNGILTFLPSSWIPYAELMRIEQRGGLYGFYFPYLIGLSYAASITYPIIAPTNLISLASQLFAWTVLLRGAACTINDIFDREYDRKVTRTRLRPIARGAVSPFQGHVWFVAQSIVGFGIVTFIPHATECMHHAVPIVALLVIYPFAKRVTDFPQVSLSIPVAWGILMSCSALGIDPFTAQSTAVATATACLVTSYAIWVIILDYVNACQDTDDDIKAGVRGMAVRYRDTRSFISIMATVQVSLMVAAGCFAGMSPFYFVVACGGNAAILMTMARKVCRDRPDVCDWWFSHAGIFVGGTTVVGLLGEYMIKLGNEERDVQKVEEKMEDRLEEKE